MSIKRELAILFFLVLLIAGIGYPIYRAIVNSHFGEPRCYQIQHRFDGVKC